METSNRAILDQYWLRSNRKIRAQSIKLIGKQRPERD